MRRALVVGIDYYDEDHISNLNGCVNDAHGVSAMLERHADGSLNFSVKLLVGSGPTDIVKRSDIKDAVGELFAGDGEVSCMYFAGHGHIERTGGYLCAGNCKTGDDGLPLAEIMTLANDSAVQNKVIVLDSCHSGIAGSHPLQNQFSELSNGVTILTASTDEQYASEENGSGVFTDLLVDALGGAASNLVGDVTPGSVYAHVDQSLGPWAQRPVFKTNVRRFISLRKVKPPIDLADLRRISDLFPTPGYQLQLDPSFEPERDDGPTSQKLPPPDPVKNEIFGILQQYNRLNLLIPEGAPHMWHAAMESRTVRLTALGEHYRRLSERSLI